ncbi:MAG: RecX family transcriptional regulator [Thermoplasmatales archaeon]|nr:RecX family transcriptional regulator [Thermoplasmatales archaeon]
MKISKIQPQTRNKNRCSIYIDGEFRFGLTNDLVVKYNLNTGNEITDEEIKNILLQEEKVKIRSRAYKILHYRERSIKELKHRLLHIGFDQLLVDEVIDDFVSDKTLDDERFARAFVSDYTKLKPKGNRFIYNELIKKGISKEVITELISGRDEKELIKNFIQKKLSNFNKTNFKERQKMIRRLLNRGFTPSIVYEIINERS